MNYDVIPRRISKENYKEIFEGISGFFFVQSLEREQEGMPEEIPKKSMLDFRINRWENFWVSWGRNIKEIFKGTTTVFLEELS